MQCPDCLGKKALFIKNGWNQCARCAGTGQVIDVALVSLRVLLLDVETYLLSIDTGGKLAAVSVNKKVKAAREQLRKSASEARAAQTPT